MADVITIKSKKRKKTISLSIAREGSIIVRAPENISEEQIQSFVRSKQRWIKSRLAQRTAMASAMKPKEFNEGEDFLYLGQNHKLKITTDDNSEGLLFYDGQFILSHRKRESARELFKSWYGNESRNHLTQRIRFYSRLMEFYPSAVKITGAQKRWGSCSPQNSLNFPLRIVMLPLEIIDYIVVHELAHIKEKNHSKRFWQIVAGILPDYKKRNNWLRQNDLSFCY